MTAVKVEEGLAVGDFVRYPLSNIIRLEAMATNMFAIALQDWQNV
jgi:hypothetical protein